VNASAIPAGIERIPQYCAPNRYGAMVIASPWDTHIKWVEVAVERQLPFFVEKPLGSLEQLPRWREIAAMDLPVNQVGYNLRFHPRYLAMRQMVPKPTGGAFCCDFDMSRWPGKAYGPPELEASHELDLALDCGLTSDSVTLNSGEENYYRGWLVHDDTALAECWFQSAEELGDQMYLDEMAHFLECVREQKPTRVPLSDGLRVLEAIACRS
jgi:predicted dehydrogenase